MSNLQKNCCFILETARDLKIYAYDAYMIECARTYNAPLLTLDNSLKEKARAKKIIVFEEAKR